MSTLNVNSIEIFRQALGEHVEALLEGKSDSTLQHDISTSRLNNTDYMTQVEPSVRRHQTVFAFVISTGKLCSPWSLHSSFSSRSDTPSHVRALS